MEKGNQHAKKMVAPIIVSIILLLYYIGFIVACFFIPMPIWGRILAAVIPAVLGGVMIFVLIERINEIRSGEEDDLSQY